MEFQLKTSKMRTKTSKWFEVKVSYDKVMEDGSEKKVTETYVVEAMTFTEAEAKIIKDMRTYISGDFDVVNINPMKFKELVFNEQEYCDLYYKAKLLFVTIDEKTEKEKKTPVSYLVQAASFDDCKNTIRKLMDDTIIDYQISSVAETKILDVFES